MRRLRAGLVGLGAMGRHHARVLQQLDQVDLVAAADPAGDRHGSLRGAGRLVAGVVDLVAEGLDYAVVCVPAGSHEAVAVTLAEAGVPALIEKPLAHDLSSALRICAAFLAQGVPAAVGHLEHYSPALARAHHLVSSSGAVGEVRRLSTVRQAPRPRRVQDVGVGLDLTTHDVHLTTWLLADDYAEVSASTRRDRHSPHEVLLAATGRTDRGVLVEHRSSWLAPAAERRLEIRGDSGVVRVDGLRAELVLTTGAPGSTPLRESFAQAAEPLTCQHVAFRDALLGRDVDLVSLAAGLRAVQVVEAMLSAARCGREIHLTHAH